MIQLTDGLLGIVTTQIPVADVRPGMLCKMRLGVERVELVIHERLKDPIHPTVRPSSWERVEAGDATHARIVTSAGYSVAEHHEVGGTFEIVTILTSPAFQGQSRQTTADDLLKGAINRLLRPVENRGLPSETKTATAGESLLSGIKDRLADCNDIQAIKSLVTAEKAALAPDLSKRRNTTVYKAASLVFTRLTAFLGSLTRVEQGLLP